MQTETVPPDLQDSFIFDAWDALGHFEAATAKLQGAFEPEVLKELAVVTHRLKGTAALYRYPQVSSLAELAERLLAQSKYLPAAETGRVRAFLEKVAVCLQDALTRIAEGRAEGDLGLELNYLGGSALLQDLLRENRDAFRSAAKLAAQRTAESAPADGAQLSLTETLRSFFREHQDDWEFFAPEAYEHLETLTETLQAVRDEGASSERLTELFRSTHTLKGAAYMVGLTPMGDLAHLLEDLMVEVREGDAAFDNAAQRVLKDGTDTLSLMLAAAEGRATNVESKTQAIWTELQTHLGLEPSYRAVTNVVSSAAPAGSVPTEAAPSSADLAAELRAFYGANHDIWQHFAPEVRGHVATVRAAAEMISEAGVADAQVSLIFRAAHTVKGAAGAVGCPVMPDVALSLERLMIEVREQGLPFGAAVAEVVATGSEVLEQLLRTAEGAETDLTTALDTFWARLEPLAETPESKQAAEVQAATTLADAANPTASTIRVSLAKLDTLMTLSNELVAARARVDRLLGQFSGLTELLDASRTRLGRTVAEFEERYLNPRLQASLPQRNDRNISSPKQNEGLAETQGRSLRLDLSEQFDELEFDSYSDLNILARSVAEMSSDLAEVQTQFGQLGSRLREETDGVEKLTRSLRGEVGRARMVAVRQLFGRLRRLVTEVPGKSYNFRASGEAVEIDNLILEAVADPLLHLVKNAAFHGIETEEVRLAAGKPAQGTLSVSARHEGNRVYIEVSDDGRGIDAPAVKAKALERGLLSAEALDKLSEREALELIFLPGLSTAEIVTTDAGRGVGMEAVAANIARLKGEVAIQSEPGRGTRFTLALPLTLIVTEALTLKVGEQLMALPADAVRVLRALPQNDFIRDGDRTFVMVENQLTEFFSLRELFGLPALETPLVQLALLDIGGSKAAFGVDTFLELEEVVVRGLEAPLQFLTHLAGAAVSGSGELVLMLDPTGVRALAGRAAGRDKTFVRPQSFAPVASGHLLLVDDSISVRKVVAKMLTRAGYRVSTAADGVEALELLRGTNFDALLSDLEMPRMNGYELIEEVRRKPDLAELPLLVMTTRAGEKHMRLAFELGATDYLTKPVDETKLLSFLSRAVAGRSVGTADSANRTAAN